MRGPFTCSLGTAIVLYAATAVGQAAPTAPATQAAPVTPPPEPSASTPSVAQASPVTTANAPGTLPPYYELYPEHQPYTNGDPVPAGYVVEKNPTKTWAIASGAVVLGVFYTYGLLSVRNGSNGSGWLYLPVVGPTGLLVTHKSHCDPKCFGMEQGSVIIDAIGQAAGAGLLIWGLTSWRLRLVREDLVRPRALITPMPVGSGYGVGALGSF